jgi:hypothetical protein
MPAELLIADYALVNQRAARSSAVLRSIVPRLPPGLTWCCLSFAGRAAAWLAFGDGNLDNMTGRQVWPGPEAAAEGGGIFLAARAPAFR